MTVAGAEDRIVREPRIRVWGEAARPFVGVLVIALWVVWAVMAWRVEPRSVDAEQVRSDVASGQILTYRITGEERSQSAWLPSASGDGWDTIGLDEATGLPKAASITQAPTGIVYWVDGSFAQTRHYDASSSAVAYETLVQEMRAGGVPLERPDVDSHLPVADGYFIPGWLALLLGFGSVLLFYRPTRVTRWGWLWLVGGVPFGLGLVALAVLELVRPRPRQRLRPTPVEPTPRVAHDREPGDHRAPGDDQEPRGGRMRGGRAFLLGLVLAVLLSVTAAEISGGTNTLWIP